MIRRKSRPVQSYVRACPFAWLTVEVEDGSFRSIPPPPSHSLPSVAVVQGGVSVAMTQPCIVWGSPHCHRGPWMSPKECQPSRSFPCCTLPRLIPSPSHLHMLTPSSCLSSSVLLLQLSPHSGPVFIFSPLYCHCLSLGSGFVIILYLFDLGFTDIRVLF